MYAAYLHYDGNTALLRLRENVRLEDHTMTLFTDSLNFDRIANLGYFFEGGMLVDEENVLTAYWGQYSPDTNQALFRDNVRLVNENFTIYADTLLYNTITQYADIVGPSRIVSEDGVIYSSRGWYHTESDRAMLLDRSRVYSNEGQQVLTGDTIFYNRATGIGEAFGNMQLEDRERNLILRGNYGFFNEFTEFGFATDMAYAIDFSQADSLFIGGDSLFMITINEDYRDFRAFDNVRIFREDFQAIADSIHYSAADSTIFMRGRPVLWHEGQQISGHEIDILMNDSTIERAYIRGSAFAIQDRGVDDQFNQLSGRDMTVYFRDGEISRIWVEGSVESIYYITEDDGFVIGLNRIQSPLMSADIENQVIERLWWGGPVTDATTTPLPQLAPDGHRLPGFVWLYYLRPLHSRDIFRASTRHADDDIIVPARSFVREEGVW
jgi:lipopolysaccharide export system protein LptA